MWRITIEEWDLWTGQEWAQKVTILCVFRKIKGSNGVHASQNLSPYLLSLLFRHFWLSPNSFLNMACSFNSLLHPWALFWLALSPITSVGPLLLFKVQTLNSDHIFNTIQVQSIKVVYWWLAQTLKELLMLAVFRSYWMWVN